jgi:hypothetical protein
MSTLRVFRSCKSPTQLFRMQIYAKRFVSTKLFLNTAPDLQKSLKDKLRIPPFFFDRMYLQANGFCGHDVWLDKDGEVEFYSMYSSAGKVRSIVESCSSGFSVLVPLHRQADVRQAPAEKDIHTTHLQPSLSPRRLEHSYCNTWTTQCATRMGMVRDGILRMLDAARVGYAAML